MAEGGDEEGQALFGRQPLQQPALHHQPVQRLPPRVCVRVREGGACVREGEEEGEGKMEGAGEGVWGGMSERESEKAQAPSQ